MEGWPGAFPQAGWADFGRFTRDLRFLQKEKGKELETYARKIIRWYFPHAKVTNQKVDPKLVIFAIYLHSRSIKATALIKVMEELWKGSYNFGKLRTLASLRDLLKDSIKEGIKSYLKGNVMKMVKSTVAYNWTQAVEMYFNYGDGVGVHPYQLIRKK
jgi:hypothetical protein